MPDLSKRFLLLSLTNAYRPVLSGARA
jgi:hypothetical protein